MSEGGCAAGGWLTRVRRGRPRLHCITNYVTAQAVANAVLAVGGSPIMAQGVRDAEDVSSICGALVLNMGTFEEHTLEAMLAAGRCMRRLGRPILLDPVGVTASAFRRAAAVRLVRELCPQVIRANASEIAALSQALAGKEAGNTCGVDAEAVPGAKGDRPGAGQMYAGCAAASALRGQSGALVVMTGAVDFVCGERCFYVLNGDPLMGRITGSGCMLDGVMGAFCAAVGSSVTAVLEEAAVAALCAHGICGELAAERTRAICGGTGSFYVQFLDALSMIGDDILERRKKVEIF